MVCYTGETQFSNLPCFYLPDENGGFQRQRPGCSSALENRIYTRLVSAFLINHDLGEQYRDYPQTTLMVISFVKSKTVSLASGPYPRPFFPI